MIQRSRGREKQRTESNGGFKQVPLKEDPDYRHHIYNLQRQPRYKTWKQNPKKKKDKNIRSFVLRIFQEKKMKESHHSHNKKTYIQRKQLAEL